MRFYREARAVAALDHPNIVRAYDIDKYEKLHFLVMEYVDGASLQEVVARHGPLDPARAAHYIAQAAVGLQHAHELGMVHRDIKPGNLLLERTGRDQDPRHGAGPVLRQAARQRHREVRRQLRPRHGRLPRPGAGGHRTSWTSGPTSTPWAARLYFLLTGQTPFPDGTVAAKLVAHQTKEPRPVADFRSDVPPELLAVLRKMMAKDPAERYQTPAELDDALAPWGGLRLPPPPANEMPDLCPAVLSLTGHAADKARSSSARLNVGTGSGLHLARGPGSSDVVNPAAARARASAGPIRSSRPPPRPAPRPSRSTRSRPARRPSAAVPPVASGCRSAGGAGP